MRALATAAESDTLRAEIWDRVRAPLAEVEAVVGVDDVLVALWQRPSRTKGGIELPDAYRQEDIYQGKVGLVLRCGELAFTPDERHRWGERVPRIDDWVVFRVADGWPLILGDQHCRIVRDVNVRLVVRRPDVVY